MNVDEILKAKPDALLVHAITAGALTFPIDDVANIRRMVEDLLSEALPEVNDPEEVAAENEFRQQMLACLQMLDVMMAHRLSDGKLQTMELVDEALAFAAETDSGKDIILVDVEKFAEEAWK
jgi:hypothetical protein